MFRTRLISGIILLILAIGFIFVGGLPLWAVSLAISLIGLYELYKVVGIEKKLLGVVGYLSVLSYYIHIAISKVYIYFELEDIAELRRWSTYSRNLEIIMAYFIIALLAIMAIYVLTFPKYSTEQVAICFMGIFYVGVFFSYLYLTRVMQGGSYYAWLIIISSWGSDTCAYVSGMLLGRHKIAPVLSPKKTVEGCLGGVIGSSLIGYIFATVCISGFSDSLYPRLTCAASCAIGAVISQIGDLAASAIKRNHSIKDYGHIIPGHGGILDRFDSMLFTAPIVYFSIVFIQYFIGKLIG